ncbi:MAG: DUF4230 domain-containing protein [Spirochaetaceae bacterium]
MFSGIPKKILISVAPPLLAATLIAGIAAAGASLIPGFSIPLLPEFSLGTKKTTSESRSLLREVRPVFLFSTVEYTYRTVFPYDFFPADTDYNRLHSLSRSAEELEDGEPEKPEGAEEVELYRLCLEMGMDVGPESRDFAVITTRIKAGFNLEESPWDPASGADSTEQPPIRIITERRSGKKSVVVSLPETEITEFILQDETSEEYNYPDLEVTASEWRGITRYVESRIRPRVIEEGILKRAEERARSYIRSLLSEGGYEEIVFERSPIMGDNVNEPAEAF